MPNTSRTHARARSERAEAGAGRRVVTGALVVTAALAGLGLPSSSVAAAEPVPVPAAVGSGHYVYVHVFFDSKASGPFEAGGCDGAYGTGTAGCSGRFASATTTPPFSDAHGTVIWKQGSGSSFELTFYTPGAQMQGTMASTDANHFAVSSFITPWTPWGYGPGDDSGIAPGQLGGPMQIGHGDHDCASTPELTHCDATFDVRGWLIVQAPDLVAAPPVGETTTTTTTSTVVPSTTTSTTAPLPVPVVVATAPAAVVTPPRFTG